MTADTNEQEALHLAFHGRILDHLGLQMYQSPVAAIAELVSNAWDADAKSVDIHVPETLGITDPKFVIHDSGVGMTKHECQTRYLNVGYNRRGKNPEAFTDGQRPVLGRKGIGKFAGFGVARNVQVETISRSTGELTKFTLNFEDLRGEEDEYVSEKKYIVIDEHLPPDEARRAQSGTKITLTNLQLAAGINAGQFAMSMARRFLLLERVEDFKVAVNSKPISEYMGEAERLDYMFPRDYLAGEAPDGMTLSEDALWATETLSDGNSIQWQIVFQKDTIKDEELRGIAVFANGKLAQSPFVFNITGGIGNQANLEYLSGRIEAAYLDLHSTDVISTERQRINWDHPNAKPLEVWGKSRIKQLLTLVGNRKARAKTEKLQDRVSSLGHRLGKLKVHERKTVERALYSLAKVENLSQDKFESVADSMLTAWEQGKLTDLISTLADSNDLTDGAIMELFFEADIITALHVAEAIKTKLEIIQKLRERIEARDLENAIRDYISEKPWIISPHWETFKVERSLDGLLADMAQKSKIDKEPDFKGRVDLILGSGRSLLLLEFMRPGLTVDRDHLTRFGGYVDEIRSYMEANTGMQYKTLTGYIVADNLSKSNAISKELNRMSADDMYAKDWKMLLAEAESQWKEFLFALKERSPDDERLTSLVTGSSGADPLQPQTGTDAPIPPTP